jgi:hypothetical protein
MYSEITLSRLLSYVLYRPIAQTPLLCNYFEILTKQGQNVLVFCVMCLLGSDKYHVT